MPTQIPVSRAALAGFCRTHAVRELAIFGSLARGEQRADSDVDVLVEFDGPATYDNYFGLKDYLERLLDKPVDLVTSRGLKPRARQQVELDLIHVA